MFNISTNVVMIQVRYGILLLIIFFFNATATTEIYTLSYTTLFRSPLSMSLSFASTLTDTTWFSVVMAVSAAATGASLVDRKSTRLNSSHSQISYAVFCLKKKKAITEADLAENNSTILLFFLSVMAF